MGLHGPIGFNGWVTEVTDFFEHGPHESGAKSLSVGQYSLTLLINCVLPTTSVVVECWEVIQKLTSPLHVPGETYDVDNMHLATTCLRFCSYF